MSNRDEAYNLRRLIEQMELDLVRSMQRNLKRHENEEQNEGFRWEMWQKAKLRRLRQFQQQNREIIGEVSPDIERAVNEALNENFSRGEGLFTRIWNRIKSVFFQRKRVLYPNDISGRKPDSLPPQEKQFFGVNDKKLDALRETVTHDLQEAQYAALRRMDDIYRRTIFGAVANMTAGVKTLDQAIDMATRQFLEAGINCIEYRDGRRVNIASYAEMALRTASHRAMLLGEGKKRDEWGIHTVVVSAHANTCPLCAPWQGKILVDDVFCHGTAEEARKLGYPLLSEAVKAGLLHPNCRHTISTYFPGITQIPAIPDPDKAAKTYKAEQDQRALESLIRKWKRIAAGTMEPEKTKLSNDKVREYQIELQNFLKEHSELRRDYNREKTRGMVEQFQGKVNESRADKLFYVVPPAKGDAIKPHSIFKALNKSPVGKAAIKYLEENQVDLEITYSDEVGEGLRGRAFGSHIEIYARNTLTIKETAKAIVHEVTHMKYNIGEDQWAEAVCMLRESEYEKGVLTAEDKRNTIKLVKRLYPDLPWRKR